ncbi:MAG: hypothetical protein H7323_09510 [Frankiales bacterium]|nr:hypothetical protein [Frankiales bacterium]
MAELTCGDGSVLVVRPVAVLDRDGAAYEVTLELLLDGAVFGQVGERCGFFLATALRRLAGPVSTLESGVRGWAAAAGHDPDATWTEAERYLPRDRELLALLARDPDDVTSAGELRIRLRSDRRWVCGDPRGRWELQQTAVVEAWGDGGRGVRAVLDHAGLGAVLTTLLAECAAVGPAPP